MQLQLEAALLVQDPAQPQQLTAMWWLPGGSFVVVGQSAPALLQLSQEEGAALLGSSAVYLYYRTKVGTWQGPLICRGLPARPAWPQHRAWGQRSLAFTPPSNRTQGSVSKPGSRQQGAPGEFAKLVTPGRLTAVRWLPARQHLPLTPLTMRCCRR